MSREPRDGGARIVGRAIIDNYAFGPYCRRQVHRRYTRQRLSKKLGAIVGRNSYCETD